MRMSSPPSNPPALLHSPPATIYTQPEVPKKLRVIRYNGEDEENDNSADREDDDDEVFEYDNEDSDKYLNFPHQEEQSQGGVFESSSSNRDSSSADDEWFGDESQGATGGFSEHR